MLAGRGRWIIQRYETDPAQIDEIYLVEAGPGEKICVPPSFGHITINAETEPLVIANVIADKVGYDYEPYKILRGAAARLLASEAPSMIEIESNRNYRVVPPLRKLKPKKDWYNGYFDPLYSVLASNHEHFKFLADILSLRPIRPSSRFWRNLKPTDRIFSQLIGCIRKLNNLIKLPRWARSEQAELRAGNKEFPGPPPRHHFLIEALPRQLKFATVAELADPPAPPAGGQGRQAR
ncbi:MAG: Glucose-6-phosphate isomerase [Parcubacteria group bacterium GW2011_GWB1_52_7]|nr:MAG: Glucose-6-phosphate isomerase [Parcubacteria group bacterium GW2011_GWB1_52_7]